jgi:hypothetical protein
MTIQTIWNALPNGLDTDHYYFSVFVSHRLSGVPAPSTLADYTLYPHFSATDPSLHTNWARAMETVRLAVSFDGGTTYQLAQRIPPGQPRFWATLDPALWGKVFPPATIVDPYVPQTPSALFPRSFRAVALSKIYDALYASAASTFGTDYPPVSDPLVNGFVQTIGTFREFLIRLRDKNPPRGDLTPPANAQTYAQTYIPWLESTIGGPFLQFGPAVADIAMKHWEAWRFYRRNVDSQYGPRDSNLVKPPPIPEPEFHKLIGMLADHPTLLRKLGFVMDFRTTRSAVAAQGNLQVLAHWDGSPSMDNRFPQTLYRIDNSGFFARQDKLTTDHVDGMLIPRTYDIVQVDVDGHAQKMIGYAISANYVAGHDDPNGPESLPARRTGGLTFMKDDRLAQQTIPQLTQVDALNSQLAKTPPNNPLDPVVLEVSDVTRGFRVDVWDGTGVWKSLCRRHGTDLVDGTIQVQVGIVGPDREGIVHASGGTSGAPDADPTEQNTLYVHEALFGWDGWSLCGQRPGRGIGHADGDGNQVAILGFLSNHAPAGYTVTSQYKVTPHSLPRLRFGQTYRFRVRLVDIAGNSFSFDHLPNVLDPITASAPATFLRYEPVAPPALVLRRGVNLGESLETVVIRSNPDPVDDLKLIVPGNNVAAYSATPVGVAAGFLPYCERHVVPPKTSQITAETHGMIDGLPADQAFRISAKEAGTLTSDTVYNIDTGVADPLPAGDLAFIWTDGHMPPPNPPAPGEKLLSGTLVLHQLDKVTLPYLPDPLSRGLTLRFPAPSFQNVPPLDPTLANPMLEPWTFDLGQWPRAHSILLTVKESATPNITYAKGTDALSIGLPPATIQDVRYSTLPDAGQIGKTATYQNLLAVGDPVALSNGQTGLNWLLSPYRTLRLIHAVQRPLLVPSFYKADIIKDVGWTYVIMRGEIQNDGRSTVHVDVNATWVDPFDDVNDPTGPHVAPDPTKRPVPSDTVRSFHTARAFEVPVKYWETLTEIGGGAVGQGTGLRHEMGDTKHRWVTYSPDGTTRYREYFPPSVTDDAANITTPGKTQIMNVLSSKRPDPIEVLYAVPTFKWVKTSDGMTRVGRGIRVYFNRPWYVTGADELVGVLLQPVIIGPPDPNLLKYVSEWGRDPVWSSTGVTEPLGISAFTNRVTVTPMPAEYDPVPPPLSTGPFALAESTPTAPLAADVVGFQPEFNYDRKLWFVDIEMDSGDSYFPFVRLALCRYQPHSVWPGSDQSQHLSRVTRTEFIQLVPDRAASVTYLAGRLITVSVTGIGAFNSLATTAAPLNQLNAAYGHNLTAQVQSRPLGSTNDLLWTAVGAVEPLGAQSIDAPDIVHWLGRLFLPANPDPSLEYRLLIKETESYISDLDVADGLTGITPHAERLVYACGISLMV